MAGTLRDPTTVGACHSGAMTEPFALYDAARARMLTLAEDVGPDALCTVVPACPDWTALDLLTHCVAMPAAIATGDLPRDDLGAWLDAILAARAGRTLEELRTEWYEVDPTIAPTRSQPSETVVGTRGVHAAPDATGRRRRPSAQRWPGAPFAPGLSGMPARTRGRSPH